MVRTKVRRFLRLNILQRNRGLRGSVGASTLPVSRCVTVRTRMYSFMGTLGTLWGFTGFTLLIGMALYRLTPLALEAFEHSLTGLQWSVLIINCLFMAYSEGYKGFQKAYSPRAAARMKYIKENPKILFVLLAPFFIMGFFHTTRKRMIVSYSLTIFIVVLIVLVHKLDQPWRGVLDAGVVVGLSWGIISFFYYVLRAFTSNKFSVDPELPVGASAT